MPFPLCKQVQVLALCKWFKHFRRLIRALMCAFQKQIKTKCSLLEAMARLSFGKLGHLSQRAYCVVIRLKFNAANGITSINDLYSQDPWTGRQSSGTQALCKMDQLAASSTLVPSISQFGTQPTRASSPPAPLTKQLVSGT